MLDFLITIFGWKIICIRKLGSLVKLFYIFGLAHVTLLIKKVEKLIYTMLMTMQQFLIWNFKLTDILTLLQISLLFLLSFWKFLIILLKLIIQVKDIGIRPSFVHRILFLKNSSCEWIYQPGYLCDLSSLKFRFNTLSQIKRGWSQECQN